jgi:phage terminase large subunit-like protein
MNGTRRAARYAKHVLDNKKLYPLTIVQAVQRFNRDKKRKDIYLDDDAANFAVRVVEMMPHTKGELAGKPMILEDWQCFFYVNVFGFKWKATNYRRFRFADLYVPRKNGKTAMAIPVALLMLCCDNEQGAEAYLGTVSQDNAKRQLFKPAKYICEKLEAFADKYNLQVNAGSIVRTDNDSVLTTVIRKPKDGDSPSFALVDEFHEHVDADQYDTFKTGMGARRQPLLMTISTAGFDLSSPCNSAMSECVKILDQTIEADNKFIMMFVPDKGDKWDSVKTLRKVNPNFGVSIGEEFLLSELEEAKRSSEKQSAFKTKYLNIWVGSRSTWMNMLEWQRQSRPKLKLDDFKGKECHLSLDLSAKIDVSALLLTFKDGEEYITFPFFYVPEGILSDVPVYQRFIAAGEMVATDGDMVDYEFIEDRILQVCKEFDVKSIAFDPHNANYLVTRLMKHIHLEEIMIEFGQTVLNMSEPMKELEARVKSRQYWHDGNSCLTWMMGNVTARHDAKGNVYPRKENDNDKRCRIDGVVAAIMGMARWMDAPEEDAYENRGFRTL